MVPLEGRAASSTSRLRVSAAPGPAVAEGERERAPAPRHVGGRARARGAAAGARSYCARQEVLRREGALRRRLLHGDPRPERPPQPRLRRPRRVVDQVPRRAGHGRRVLRALLLPAAVRRAWLGGTEHAPVRRQLQRELREAPARGLRHGTVRTRPAKARARASPTVAEPPACRTASTCTPTACRSRR